MSISGSYLATNPKGRGGGITTLTVVPFPSLGNLGLGNGYVLLIGFEFLLFRHSLSFRNRMATFYNLHLFPEPHSTIYPGHMCEFPSVLFLSSSCSQWRTQRLSCQERHSRRRILPIVGIDRQ
jgi:hypothetical protein